MKYSNQIDINLPLNRVIELFDSSDNLSKWQPSLLRFEHLSGEPGQVGAKSKMVYKRGKGQMEMIETITLNELPHRMNGTYEMKGTLNLMSNKFEAVDANTTRWISDTEFRFSSFPMKMMGWLMPGAFKKQSQKFMDQFKAFAEGEG